MTNQNRVTMKSAWLSIILLAALAVRVVGLDYSLWYDEIVSTQYAKTPLAVLWSDWMLRESNPPLYYSILSAWTSLFGETDSSLRMLSVLIGLTGILLIYFLGENLFGAHAGLTAAALTAFSAQHIYYSQHVRAYALTFSAAAAVMLAAVLFRQALAAGHFCRAWLIVSFFVLANAIALYAHTTMLLLTLLVNVWLFASTINEKKHIAKKIKILFVANFMILAIWLWWGRITWLQLNADEKNVVWIEMPSVLYAVRMTLESFVPWSLGPARFVTAALAVIAAVAAFVKWRRTASLPMMIIIGGPVLLYLISLVSPAFLPRTIYWASSAFVVLVAAGLCTPAKRSLRRAFIALAIIVSAWNTLTWWPTRQLEPWRQIVAKIQAINPQTLVFVQGRGIALALERYCQTPACNLTIASIKTDDDDRWVSAFSPRLEVEAVQAKEMLTLKRQAILVDWLGLQPGTALGDSAKIERLVDVPGLPSSIRVMLVAAK